MEFVNKKITIPISSKKFEGVMTIPSKSKAIIVFVHGGGGAVKSPRNNAIARVLNKNNFGTLLFELLTDKEDLSNKNNLNIDLLSTRLLAATKWLIKQPMAQGLKIGYFSVSSGTAAAIRASSKLRKIFAIVSKSGRPDLSMSYLSIVKAPILFIVGEDDEVITTLNEQAFINLSGEKSMVIIPNAGHFFDEPGTSKEVAKFTLNWFKKYSRK
ncbi:MAG: dienelactone hydrolase family protein [Candidatus Micrarchaeota archaeon]